MANTKEEQKNLKLSSTTAKDQPKNCSRSLRTSSLIPKLSFIFALGALLIAGYALYMNVELVKHSNDKNTSLSNKIQLLAENKGNSQQQIDDLKNNSTQAQTLIQNKLDNLSKQLHQTRNQKADPSEEWLLLKARYYLELAQINTHWSKNFDATMTLLQQADQVLARFNDPKVFKIRQVLAKDIALLQALPQLDRAGILSQLDALQENIHDLSITLPANKKQPIINSEQSSWRMRMQESLDLLDKMVVIRRHDQEIKPLLSPELEALLKETLKLNLQEAQWAVLYSNSAVYQLALKQVIQNIKDNFNVSTENTASLLKKLHQLQQYNLTPTTPELGAALPMLNELINSKRNPLLHSNEKQGENQQ